MNKKGFSLLEILAAIMILGILSVIAIPIVQNIVNNSKDSVYNVAIESIKDAANQYTMQYGSSIPGLSDSGVGYITLSDLENKGIISNSVQNPKTGDNFDNGVAVKITTLPNGKYNYTVLLDGKPKPTKVWGKSFGGSLGEVYNKVDNVATGYIAVGTSNSSDIDLNGLAKGSQDAIIVKYDLNGAVVWKKVFGGTDVDSFTGVVAVSDGYVACGSSFSTTGDMSGLQKGLSTAILVKYDLNGNLVWKKAFGGTIGTDFSNIADVSTGYIVTGSSTSSDGDLSGLAKGSQDAIIVKYDLNGAVVWKKAFGGTANDNYNAVTALSNGYVAVGSSDSTDVDLINLYKGEVKNPESPSDAIIVNYDLNGNIIWKKAFGGSALDEFKGVTSDSSSNIVTVGFIGSTDYDMENVVKQDDSNYATAVKYDSAGNIIWIRNYWSYEFADINSTSDGYIAIGRSAQDLDHSLFDAFAVKYDFNGAVIWEDVYKGGSSDEFYGVSATSGGCVAVGYSSSNDRDFFGLNKGGADAIIFKLSSTAADTTPPTVTFGTNGNATYAKTRSTTVTITDATGVDSSSLKYQWTTSTTAPTEGSFSTTFTSGGTISSPAGVTGGYYLWILAKDTVTTQNTTITMSNLFNLDNTIPVITMLGSTPVSITQGSTYTDAGATASDNIDGTITANINTVSTVNPNVVGSYTVTYNVNDAAGNAATAVVRTVNVVAAADVTPPTVTFGTNGNSTYAKTRSTTVTVTDGTGVNSSSLKYQWTTSTTAPTEGSFSTTFTSGGTINTPAGVTGGYYLWILAKDTASTPNTAITSSNIFNLDNTIPVITMLGSTPVSITQGSTYTDAGATASDNIDGTITGSIQVTSTVNPNVVGGYTVTYNVNDSSGNAATAVVRTVNVIAGDVTPPTVTFGTNGNSTYAKTRSTTVTVTDGTGVNSSSLKYQWTTSTSAPTEGSFSLTFTNGGSVSSTGGVTGGYYLWILAKDTASTPNTAITRSNVFNLDNTIPVITMLGSTPVSITQGSTYTDAGATATDNIDGTITGSINATSTVNPNVVGTYTVTYNVNDSSGNAATAVVRTVNVTASGGYTDYIAGEGVNKPRLITGMTAVKWNSGTSTWDTVSDPDNDTSWYNYANKEWANAETADGSFWVWIPRYAYQIATYYHVDNSTPGTLNVKFLKDNTNTASDSSTVATSPTYSGASQTNYVLHPAFVFGSLQLTGIWVAKFEASGTTAAIDIKPSVVSLRTKAISNFSSSTRNMETNSRYGWGTTGSGIDTHLMKNIEWGAIEYLSLSSYGAGASMWINPANNYTTGCAGNTINSAATTGCLNVYSTANGVKASTTASIYGVYDMRGGALEYMAAYIDNGNAALASNGSNLVSADIKYKDLYTPGSPDSGLNNFAQASSKIGDGLWEISLSDGTDVYAWGGIWLDIPNTSNPFFLRGGLYSDTTDSTIVGILNTDGTSFSQYGFRPVLAIDPSL